MKEPSLEEKLSDWFYGITYSSLGKDRKAFVDNMARDLNKSAQQSVHLTALRRGVNLSFSVNILLAILLVISLIGGR